MSEKNIPIDCSREIRISVDSVSGQVVLLSYSVSENIFLIFLEQFLDDENRWWAIFEEENHYSTIKHITQHFPILRIFVGRK